MPQMYESDHIKLFEITTRKMHTKWEIFSDFNIFHAIFVEFFFSDNVCTCRMMLKSLMIIMMMQKAKSFTNASIPLIVPQCSAVDKTAVGSCMVAYCWKLDVYNRFAITITIQFVHPQFFHEIYIFMIVIRFHFN